MIPVVFFTFAAGLAAGWWGRAHYEPPLTPSAVGVGLPTSTRGDVSLVPRGIDRAPAEPTARTTQADPVTNGSSVDALARKNLRLPIDGADLTAWKGQFGDKREQGTRGHEAVDILAPRGTPVHAVEDGTIEKLFLSKKGGITAYQFDPSKRFCYYYAHLERYASGLHEKQVVSKGDVIGYVGTTGNAPPNTPHLHFAIFELSADKHWWQGQPIDPWLAFAR